LSLFCLDQKSNQKSQENPIRKRTSEPEHGGFSGHHTLSRNLVVINQLKKHVIGRTSGLNERNPYILY